MKRKAVRIICIVLVCLLLIGSLTYFLCVNCRKQEEDDPDSGNVGQETYDPNAGISDQSAGDLVKNGTTSYKILLSADATIPEFTAANELNNYVNKLTRCSLPIEIESDYLLNNINDDSCYISIGRTKLLEKQNFQIEYDKLNGNGFVIKTKGKNAYFVGANDQGTIYSVYDFLEKICGIKFLAYDYEYIPKDMSDIVLPVMDIKEVPKIKYRSYMSEEVLSDASFNAKMRMVNEYDNDTAMAPYGGSIGFCKTYGASDNIAHNAIYYVPIEVYGNDERYADMYHETKRNGVYADINLANGIADDGNIDESMEVSTIKVALESLKQFALDNPNAVYFSIGPSDGAGYPTNESARIAAEKFSIEGVALRFYNCLAREIQKWADEELNGREINVVTMAYGYSYRAPVDSDGNGGYKLKEGVTEIPDNLYIRLAPIGSFHTLNIDDPKQSQIGEGDSGGITYMQWYKEWASICDNFMIWQYSKRFWDFFWYFPTMQTWYKMYTHYINMGVDYLMTQSSNTCLNDWQAIMETYCSSKMMWNPNRDLTALQNEFIHYYFGEDAEIYVRQMLDNYDGRYRWMEEHSVTLEYGDYGEGYLVNDMHYQSYNIINPKNWPFSFLEDQMNLLDTAMEKTNANANLTAREKETFIRNVERVKITPLYMAYYNREKYNISDQTIISIYNEMFRIVDKLGETVCGEVRFFDGFRR